MIRVILPYHLRNLAKLDGELELAVESPVTQSSVFDAIEKHYPMLRGTIRDYRSQKRRSHLRIFACGKDISHESPETPLPNAVAAGDEPLRILGALSGG